MDTTKFNKAKTTYKTILPQAKGYIKPVSKFAKFAKLGGAVVGGAIGAYQTVKNAPKIVKDVKAINKNWGYVRKSRKKTENMRRELVDKKTTKKYTAKHGEKADWRAENPGGLLNPDQRKKNKMRDQTNKDYGYLKAKRYDKKK